MASDDDEDDDLSEGENVIKQDKAKIDIATRSKQHRIRGSQCEIGVEGVENSVAVEGDHDIVRTDGQFHRISATGDLCKVKLKGFHHRLVMTGYSNVGEIQGTGHHVRVRGLYPAVRLYGKNHTLIVEGEERCRGIIITHGVDCAIYLPRGHEIKVDDFGRNTTIREVMLKHTEKKKKSVKLAGNTIVVHTAPSLNISNVAFVDSTKYTVHRKAEIARIEASRPPGYLSILKKPKKA